ncbi:MAG: amidase [Pleurocapsa sp. MO_226.B13]|nr:amidase [Pleurocapsa sp. MO_226.B13]
MEIVFATASQLAQMIRDKEVSALEVVNAYLEQIEKHNGKINAIATLNREEAKTRAIEADEALARGENWGALHGVPITIKDALETKGLRSTCNYKPLTNYIPQQDAIAVERLRSAGAIIMAKTNCASLAGDYQTHGAVFARANNPWNLDYTPGGSTGGGAAAVAAGLSPLELGSDGGGSIRQPAHCCGIFGFKPTDRLVPTLGHLPELPGYPKSIRHVLTIGALARCVEDLKLCLSLIAGADSRQPEIPPVTLNTPAKKSLSSLRIAWTSELGNLKVDPEISSTLSNFVTRLTEAGCHVEQQIPQEFDFDTAWETYGEVYASELLTSEPVFTWDNISFTLKLNFSKIQVARQYRNSPIERGFLKAFPVNFSKYMQSLTKRDCAIAQMDDFLADWDAYLCPVSTITAFPHQPKGKPIEVNGIKLPYITACGGYAILFNFTGHPVVVIPIGRSQSGLPIGIQIVGKRWQDLELLAIAEKINEIACDLQHPSL